MLSRTIAGRPVHRRRFVKADGRDLTLYGYAPHTLSPEPQTHEQLPKGGELRFHPLRQVWSVFAAHRQNRTFKPSASDDPLAPTLPGGAETEIPFANFELAVFDNKFSSLHPDCDYEGPVFPGVTQSPAAGKCEVIVYAPEPTGNLASLGQEKRRLLVGAWIDRYEILFSQGRKFVMPFENRGDEVGVTLHHPHGQIYGFDFIPSVQKAALSAFEDGYSLSKQLGAWADTFGVASAGSLMAFAPPFARFPYETWIASRHHCPGPWAFNEEDQDAFAFLIGEVTRKYDAFFGRETPYMMALHASPAGSDKVFEFTTQFYPILRSPEKVKYLASVEQNTSVFTVDVMPEQAAKILRDL